MAKSCVDTLVFTFNLRIGWLERAGKPTPEISHKRGNHPLRLPFLGREMAILASLDPLILRSRALARRLEG